MRILLLLLVLVGVDASAMGQAPSPSRSNTMMRFLNPGDLVGVKSVDGTMTVSISTYSQQQYQLAKAILEFGRSTRNAKKFAEENEVARAALERYIREESETPQIEDQLAVMPLIRTSLGKVTEVGDDYVLVEFEGPRKRRCVIAKSTIGMIYLDASPIRFFGPRRAATTSLGSQPQR